MSLLFCSVENLYLLEVEICPKGVHLGSKDWECLGRLKRPVELRRSRRLRSCQGLRSPRLWDLMRRDRAALADVCLLDKHWLLTIWKESVHLLNDHICQDGFLNSTPQKFTLYVCLGREGNLPKIQHLENIAYAVSCWKQCADKKLPGISGGKRAPLNLLLLPSKVSDVQHRWMPDIGAGFSLQFLMILHDMKKRNSNSGWPVQVINDSGLSGPVSGLQDGPQKGPT